MKGRLIKNCLLFALLFGFSVQTGVVSGVAETSYSKAECVMEADSRRILYEAHGDVRLPMASTTKIVTAITVIENSKNLDEKFCVPEEAAGVEGSSVYLKAGEEISPRDLLYGLMLRSGNDCAVALAVRTAGSVGRFSALMNATAQKAGALNSRFRNPHGLPLNNHYTTAVDLSHITAYAMQNELFRQIVSTKYYEAKNWKNKNKMLATYEGAKGVKTGYTKEAGRCLVTAAERNGMTLICTVLGCPMMYERTKMLLDDSFSRYQMVDLVKKDEVLQISDNLQGRVAETISYPMREEEREYVSIETRPYREETNEKIVGQFQIFFLKRLLFFGNLYKL